MQEQGRRMMARQEELKKAMGQLFICFGAGLKPVSRIEFGSELLWEIMKQVEKRDSFPCADGRDLYNYISLLSDLGKLLVQSWLLWAETELQLLDKP